MAVCQVCRTRQSIKNYSFGKNHPLSELKEIKTCAECNPNVLIIRKILKGNKYLKDPLIKKED